MDGGKEGEREAVEPALLPILTYIFTHIFMLCTKISNCSVEFDSYYMKSLHISEGRTGVREE